MIHESLTGLITWDYMLEIWEEMNSFCSCLTAARNIPVMSVPLCRIDSENLLRPLFPHGNLMNP